MSKRTLNIAPAFILAAIAACGPCEATIVTVGDIDLCPDGGDEGGGTGEGGGDGPTDGDECVDVPAVGAIGGPCATGSTCTPIAEHAVICVTSKSGNICTLPCPPSGTCGDYMCGASDVCVPGAVCESTCTGDADCPHGGMTCESGRCYWPDDVAPACEGSDVPGQAFAPCLDDFTCDAPGSICATDSNGTVCIPISSDMCAEEHAGCAGPTGFGTGYGAQNDACTLACTADTDCAVAGMVCGPNFGLCLWP